MFNDYTVNTLQITPLPDLSQQTQANLGVPAWLAQVNQEIDHALKKGISIRQLVTARAAAVDELLIALFKLYKLDETDLTLFATGGYGRGELSLHSDVDILLLSPDTIDAQVGEQLNQFIAKLWDIGIEPALAVRTIEESIQVTTDDHTIASTILEARYLVGNESLKFTPKHILEKTWSQIDFYNAKMEEAKQRYLQHNSTEYNLEPDIKNAPGGLRDIHVIGWVSKRYFRVSKLYDLVQQDFLTEREFDELQQSEEFLWTIRHHLHTLNGRNENKLLFDYQREIAKLMGYEDTPEIHDSHGNAAIENFMRDYYRCAMHISTLSEMLTAHYYELVIEPNLDEDKKPKKVPLNALFNQIGNQIAIAHHRVFAQHPDAILQMFLLMGQHGIKNVRTRTLRALKIAARGIGQAYRDNPKNKQLFLANIKEQNYLYHRLRTMKRYGVLGHYIPEFGRVTGLMQFDLFHRYTVDAHTLFVVRILHRFTDDKYRSDYDLVSSIYQRIERKDILVLAALFHDIAKGRGGDHSELGEVEAIEFCLHHGMSEADANLIGWLTRQHLLMSSTAQKKDISDPEVINEFAEIIGNVTHLNHLYVLTVADMNATNSQIWNSWRASLMKQLYTYTRRMLKADINTPTNRDDMITVNREKATQIMMKQNSKMNQQEVITLWDELGDEYFLREIPEDILWHTQEILKHPPIGKASDKDSEPLVSLREHRDIALDAIQIFVYTQNQENLFAVTMAVFDQMDFDVLDARIITGTRDFALDSYIILDRQGTLLKDPERQDELKNRLITAFKSPTAPKFSKRRIPRRLKNFNVPTKVNFEENALKNQHMMSLVTLDRPSLLAQVGQIFLEQGIEVHSARITTLGEKAEDIFYISDKNDNKLSKDKLEILKSTLIKALDT
ncbi:MAG: [protein-PII] uridylyltransferase [Gammaproteobacteria bacterium]|nr:MAG: [protein-PII] uridylyltransferase [Gammaproteobacteria bacterium]